MAIIRDNTLIWIVPVDTDPSTLIKTTGGATPELEPIKGTITDYEKSGGESSTDTTATFGGDVKQQGPRDQFEMSFDILTSVESLPNMAAFALMEDTSNEGVYTTYKLPSDVAIFIEANDGAGTPTFYSWGFNKCSNTAWDISHSAEENQTGTLSFTFSGLSEDGTPNYMEGSGEVTSLPDWSTLDKA